MGQYYKIVNLDKKEYLHPHKFGDGLKLLEFGLSGMGTLAGLTVLLADGNNRGGGDLRSDNPLIGSWAGDRIVVTGDYADEGKFVRSKKKNLYTVADEQFKDISDAVLEVMAEDSYVREHFAVAESWTDGRETILNRINRKRVTEGNPPFPEPPKRNVSTPSP